MQAARPHDGDRIGNACDEPLMHLEDEPQQRRTRKRKFSEAVPLPRPMPEDDADSSDSNATEEDIDAGSQQGSHSDEHSSADSILQSLVSGPVSSNNSEHDSDGDDVENAEVDAVPSAVQGQEAEPDLRLLAKKPLEPPSFYWGAYPADVISSVRYYFGLLFIEFYGKRVFVDSWFPH